MPGCLSFETLEEIARSGVDDCEAGLSAHLSTCAKCRQKLEEVRVNLEIFDACVDVGSDAMRRGPVARGPGSSSSGNSMMPGMVQPLSPNEMPVIEGYDLIEALRHGAQGAVFRAVQRSTHRTVALKVLLYGAWASRRQRRRFEREIDLVAGLEHPNIVRLYDSGKAEGRRYFAMEFIEGLSLTDYVVANRLKPKEILSLFAKICHAAAYAHSRGVIHRDLKPSNILVDSNGEPHVVDFGLAKPVDPAIATPESLATRTGDFFGTLAYASPEQISGDPHAIDTRTDVYALGVILYELLTGAKPYPTTGSLSQVLHHINETEPSRPSRFTPELADEVDTIVQKALEKEADRRYRSVDALVADVERYLSGRPIEAKPYSSLYVLRKTIARHKTVAALTATLLASLMALALMAVESARRTARQRDRAIVAEAKAVEEARAARRSLYFNRIALAAVAFEKNDTTRMKEMLEACPAKPRGWEWYRLTWLSDRSCLTYTGHKARPNFAAFSPDVALVASAAESGRIKVWDPRTGGTTCTLRECREQPTHLQFSAHGKALLAMGDRAARVWVLPDPSPVASLSRQHYAVFGFSPDERYLIRAQGETISLLDLSSGKVSSIVETRAGGMCWAGLSPDGDRLVTAHTNGHLRAWSLPSGEMLFDRVHEGLHHAALSDDGSRIATISRNAIKVWDGTSGASLFTIDLKLKGTPQVCFSPDGRRILARESNGFVDGAWNAATGKLLAKADGRDATRLFPGQESTIGVECIDLCIRVTDAATKALRADLLGHTGPIRCMSSSLDGKWLVTASMDRTCKIWDPYTFGHAMAWEQPEPLHAAAFSPDGKRIVTGGFDRTVRVWQAAQTDASPMVLRGHTDMVMSVAFSPDGLSIVSAPGGDEGADNTPRIWDAATGRVLRKLVGHTNGVPTIAYSPNGDEIASGSWDRTVRIWDARTGKQLGQLQHDDEVWELAISPNGKWLASGCRNAPACVWDLRSRALVRKIDGHTNPVDAVAFSPDSRLLLTGDNDGNLICWDLVADRRRWIRHTKSTKIYSATFTPDGRRILTGGKDRITVFTTDTGQLVMSWRAHGGSVFSLDFTADGRRLLSAGGGSFKVWPALCRTGVATHNRMDAQ